MNNQTKFYTSTFYKLVAFSVVIGFLLRIVLLFNDQTEVAFSLTDWLILFLVGAVNDVLASVVASAVMWLMQIFMSQSKYNSPWGYVIFTAIAVCLAYTTFFNTVFDDYGSIVPQIVCYFLTYKLISFGIRLFIPRIRQYWSAVAFYFVFFVYILCILINAVSEYHFWAEFGVRYNFIAVDYLVYTNEVIGNIFESYPIIPMFLVLVGLSVGITYLLNRKSGFKFDQFATFKTKLLLTISFFVLAVVSGVGLQFTEKLQNSPNVYVNELQANGGYKFYTAFVNSQLDYNTFYITLPEKETIDILNREYNSVGRDNMQQIKDSLPELHKNIVLITVESLSASFLAHHGNTEGITPNLDKLMDESLAFTNLFATGNRTVRGLEAVTLCIPPSPGESIIKRPNNGNLFSTGKLLREKGYTTQFLYGGDKYFDNMGTFFAGNGYDVIDKNLFAKDEITFSNIWGVCDEDMFNKAITVFGENAKSGKPFFGHIMTVSNHRPFTYPDGKIDITSDSKSRNGGVKYTDYAIGKFIEDARKQAWFDNTVFVIVSDHCASSAGRTHVPLEKYQIVGLIYAPAFVQPQKVSKLVSQIDVMPTVFGLLNFSYESQFYGKDVFSPHYKSKAFVATYQNLGYWENDMLTVLSPVKQVVQYQVQPQSDNTYNLNLKNDIDSVYLKKAISNYQSVGYRKKGE